VAISVWRGGSMRSVPSDVALKGKEYHTSWGVLVACSYPLFRPWARRWINHLNLWHMASATPDLRLPSQSPDITAVRLVPNYTAWSQRHMCVNNLPKVVTCERNVRKLNSRPLESQANALTLLEVKRYVPRWKGIPTYMTCARHTCH